MSCLTPHSSRVDVFPRTPLWGIQNRCVAFFRGPTPCSCERLFESLYGNSVLYSAEYDPVLAACGGARCIARLGRISSAAREGNLLRMSLSKEQVATAEPAVVEVDDQSDTIAPLHKAAYFDPATIVGCPPQSWVRQHLPHGPPLFAVKNSFTGRWTSYFRWPPPFPFKCTWSRRFWARVAARRCSAVPKR
jgi:hypothetical protein